MVEPSFQGENKLFVLAFENDKQRTSHSGYYLSNVEIKNHNVMINGENLFDQPIRADPRAVEQINFTVNLDRAGNTRIYFILEEAK